MRHANHARNCANRVPPHHRLRVSARSRRQTLEEARRGETCPIAGTSHRRRGLMAPPPHASPQSARERLLGARTSSRPRESIKGFREVVNEVHDLGAATAKVRAIRPRHARFLWTGRAALLAPDRRRRQPPLARDFEPEVDAEDWSSAHEEPDRPRIVSRVRTRGHPAASYPRGISRMPRQEMTSITFNRPLTGGVVTLVAIVVGVIILAGVWRDRGLAMVQHHRALPALRPLWARNRRSRHRRHRQQQPKFSGRVPQEQSAGQALPRARKAARRRRRRLPSALCSMRRIRAIRRASAA